MSSEVSRDALLAAVDASPDAVAVHDRAAWLGLFAADAVVNDPVGSKPHCTSDERVRFYDTFIAPNDIRFEVEVDTVCGMSVVRDLTIMTAMPSGLRLGVPTHIRYELVQVEGVLQIQGLYAHWELLPMIWQVFTGGWPGVKTMYSLSVNMLRHQGLVGVQGFMRGFVGIGGKGKRSAETFLQALQGGRVQDAAAQCHETTSLTMPDGGQAGVEQLSQACSQLRWHKVIAAGRMVTASIQLAERKGLVLLEFASGDKISGLRWYL